MMRADSLLFNQKEIRVMNHQRRLKAVCLVGAALLLAALACNAGASGQEPTATPTVTPTGGEVGEATTEATEEATAEVTDEATAESTTESGGDSSDGGECNPLNASFISDVTIPDGTELDPEETFTKTWRLNNNGCEAWPAGTKLVYVSGNQMGGPNAVTVPDDVPAGINADVSVNLTAPAVAGTYRGDWRLETSDGTQFGPQIYLEIVVVGAATEEPTEEPTEEATEEPATERTYNNIDFHDNETRYLLYLTRPGTISATATWSGGPSSQALIINGPGKVNAYAREDGGSGVSVDYDVSSGDLSSGPLWILSVVNFEGGSVNGSVSMTWPGSGVDVSYNDSFGHGPTAGRAIALVLLSGPGDLTGTATWSGSPASMSMIINGPGKTGYYARSDGASPLDVDYTVTSGDYSAGALWRISWAAFSAPSGLSGTIDLSFP
jgi:hypothetical protein